MPMPSPDLLRGLRAAADETGAGRHIHLGEPKNPARKITGDGDQHLTKAIGERAGALSSAL
ncbi:MAG: hypothetical protein CML66_09110 [Rhodobacteraceae bacterium]|nr:hypothetical protein [Paracoccaceae bacterium]MAY46801.1 hypothetical protein [Paracoccaceae bacterium]